MGVCGSKQSQGSASRHRDELPEVKDVLLYDKETLHDKKKANEGLIALDNWLICNPRPSDMKARVEAKKREIKEYLALNNSMGSIDRNVTARN